jgi:hypothetical protein
MKTFVLMGLFFITLGNASAQSFEETLKLAENGDDEAQKDIGWMYYSGKVEQDYTQAFKWFSKSAEQGNAYAQYNLGNMYENGDYVLKSPQKAFEWYLKSANQEFNYSQLMIGKMYFNGEGTLIDKKKAVFWIQKAYENECIEAKYFWEKYELWKYE